MKKLRTSFVVIAVSAISAIAMRAFASGDLVKFPGNFESGVRYTTVERGNIKEDIFTSRAAIEAAKRGEPLPSGTVITLVDYRDGKLFRYAVMEKRNGWGVQYPESKRNGEWEYQAFNATKTVNRSENLDRCFSCHKSQTAQDFVFTLGQMKDAK
jgi:Cytochrome P460